MNPEGEPGGQKANEGERGRGGINTSTGWGGKGSKGVGGWEWWKIEPPLF